MKATTRSHEDCMIDNVKSLMRIWPTPKKSIEIVKRHKSKDGTVIAFEDGSRYVVRIDKL